jgi:hypothetical protein
MMNNHMFGFVNVVGDDHDDDDHGHGDKDGHGHDDK